MLLTVDIGNTSVTLALMKGQTVASLARVSSRGKPADLRRETERLLSRWSVRLDGVERVMMCSVVPDATRVLERVLKRHLRVPLLLVGRDVTVPIRNYYRYPEQVGQDRLVGAYAAWKLYGAPAVVIDLGTATTIDAVSSSGGYLGGLIVPGLEMSAEALYQKTALLPQVKITRPKTLIGKDTQESIRSGIFFGYGEMLKGLIAKMRTGIPGTPRVIITGGYAELIRNYLAGSVDYVAESLVLQGLVLLASEEPV